MIVGVHGKIKIQGKRINVSVIFLITTFVWTQKKVNLDREVLEAPVVTRSNRLVVTLPLQWGRAKDDSGNVVHTKGVEIRDDRDQGPTGDRGEETIADSRVRGLVAATRLPAHPGDDRIHKVGHAGEVPHLDEVTTRFV